jgi:PhnB protein
MARVSTYLNFTRSTEAAFVFYKSVFGTEFSAPITRFKDLPAQQGQPALSDSDKNLVMHVELPILAGHVLMGSDVPEFTGFAVTPGNDMRVMLEPDTRAETDRLFKALSEGGDIEMALQEMFWDGYFGSLTDRYGIRWMFNCSNKT